MCLWVNCKAAAPTVNGDPVCRERLHRKGFVGRPGPHHRPRALTPCSKIYGVFGPGTSIEARHRNNLGSGSDDVIPHRSPARRCVANSKTPVVARVSSMSRSLRLLY